MQIPEEKLSGIFFILIGLFFGYHSLEYKIGTVSKISSGFFPFWISVLITLLGIIIFCFGFIKDKKINIDLKIPLYILLILILFIFVFKYTGFILAGLFLIWASAIAHEKFTFQGTLIISIIYSILILIFKSYILHSLPL